jgi:hypothetical protein
LCWKNGEWKISKRQGKSQTLRGIQKKLRLKGRDQHEARRSRIA